MPKLGSIGSENMSWYCYIIPFILLGVILFFLPVEICVNYYRLNKEDKIDIQIKYLFIKIRNMKTKPLTKILSLLARRKYDLEEVQEAMHSVKIPDKNWLLILKRLRVWIPKSIQVLAHAIKLTTKIFKPVKCKKLKLHSEIGFFDASLTAIATGSMWAINSYILSQLSRWMVINPETINVKVLPDYTKDKLLLDYQCIIVFPLGHIIIVLLQTARFMRVSYHLFKGVTQ